MGSRRSRRAPAANVRGTARVVSATRPANRGAVYAPCTMQLVVELPGVAPYAWTHQEFAVGLQRWPQPGSTLPVLVDVADQHRLKVLWNEVPDSAEVGRAQAEQLAALLRGQAAQSLPPPPLPPPPPPPSASGGVQVLAGNTGGDPVTRLEKLVQLHDAGIVDEAQFTALRLQILRQAGIEEDAAPA